MTEVPNFNLTGKVALVTGAARGLGRAIALGLAHAGADIALGLRDAGRQAGQGDGLVAEISAMGRRVEFASSAYASSPSAVIALIHGLHTNVAGVALSRLVYSLMSCAWGVCAKQRCIASSCLFADGSTP